MKHFPSTALIIAVAVLAAGLVAACSEAPPPMSELRVTDETTGADLATYLTGDETDCVSSAMGGSAYDSFEGAPLLDSAGNADTKLHLVGCLETEDMTTLGVRLMSARMGGWSEGTLGCISDIAAMHPELVSASLGVDIEITAPSHPTEIHSSLIGLYECMETREKVDFSVVTFASIFAGAKITGKELVASLTQADATCLRKNLPEGAMAMIGSMPAVSPLEITGSTPPAAMACFSQESFSNIVGSVMAAGLGATADSSRACLTGFASEHAEFIDLARDAMEDPDALSEDEYLEVANDSLLVFRCLTEDELVAFQERHLPSMAP